jgi:hypothetical protein
MSAMSSSTVEPGISEACFVVPELTPPAWREGDVRVPSPWFERVGHFRRPAIPYHFRPMSELMFVFADHVQLEGSS